MSLTIQIFKSDDYLPDGEIPLLPLLHEFFRPVIGEAAEGRVTFRLLFLGVSDKAALSGTPSVVNLRSSHGYVQVQIRRDGQLLYRHPHPVREIIAQPLRSMLAARDPETTHWGFGVRGQALDRIPLVRPAPRVANEIGVAARPRRARLFRLEEMAEPEPPWAGLAELGVAVPEDGDGNAADPESPIRVVMTEEIRTAFAETLPFSSEVEEGGFLAGNVFRDVNREGGYLVQVNAVIQAERTGASMLNFTFTGESFLRINEQIVTRGRGEKLLGWYHTHLFPATDSLGLSSVDVDLHRSIFRQPWQVAALVNISDNGRTLRFYRNNGKIMAKAPYLTASE